LWLSLLFLCVHYLFHQLHRSGSYLVSGCLLVNMQSVHHVLLGSFMSQRLYILCLSLISSIHTKSYIEPEVLKASALVMGSVWTNKNHTFFGSLESSGALCCVSGWIVGSCSPKDNITFQKAWVFCHTTAGTSAISRTFLLLRCSDLKLLVDF
jgi:hypothetical protein